MSEYYGIGNVLRGTEPFTVIVDADNCFVLALKTELLNRQLRLNDGYEHLEFQAWLFAETPVINLRPTKTRTNDKITKSSFVLRLLTAAVYEEHCNSLMTPDSFLVIGNATILPVVSLSCPRIFHLAEVTSIALLRAILL